MLGSINELSFISQAKDIHDANLLMRDMLEVIRTLKRFRAIDQLCSHSELYQRKLSSRHTVLEWVRASTDREMRYSFIEVITKGPYIDGLLDKSLPFHSCMYKQQDATSSSLAGTAHFKGTLISLKRSSDFESDYIVVQFSEDGETYREVEFRNFTDSVQVFKDLHRKYVPNPKHAIGGWGSLMDLSDDVAQQVLNDGIQDPSGKQIYSYHQGKFYEFQPDNAGGYHGYLIQDESVPTKVLKLMRERRII